MKLTGKTALITGGGTGIGAACAVALARAGCRVAVAGRREEKLREVAAAYGEKPEILTHAVDVADRKSVQALFDWAAAAPRERWNRYGAMNGGRGWCADFAPRVPCCCCTYPREHCPWPA